MTTVGEIRIRPNFNTKKLDSVQIFKNQSAILIDMLEDSRKDGCSEKQRLISIAQTKLEEACMFAVKAFTTECGIIKN